MMRRQIKKMISVLLHPIATRMGYVNGAQPVSEVTVLQEPSLESFLALLKRIGFTPKHIMDIGANRGYWTRKVVDYYPEAIYTLVEPQERLKEDVEDMLGYYPKMTLHNVGAGAQSGIAKFTIVDRDDSCHFRAGGEVAQDDNLVQLDIQVITVNEFLRDKQLPIPDLLKIDAEGLDLQVLDGASDCLGKTEIILVEAAVMNKLFDNSMLAVMIYMNEHGYTLFDITELNRPFPSKVLWLTELVFVKKYGWIHSLKYI